MKAAAPPRHTLLVGAALLGVIILSHCSHAAGFNCAHAGTERENLVCGNPELSQTDADLATLYARALTRVSSQGAAALRSDQRGWLRFINQACPIHKDGGMNALDNARFCLGGFYAERKSSLQTYGIQMGAFRFITRENDRAIPLRALCVDNSAGKDGIEQDSLKYPQIDAPLDAQTLAWNEMTRTTALRMYDKPHWVVKRLSYELGVANSRLISLRWLSASCNGTRAGSGEAVGQTTLLHPRPHVLVATDLFHARSDWRRLLADRAEAAVKRTDQGSAPGFPMPLFRSIATDPANWLLRNEGLSVQTSSDAFGRCGPCEVSLPWTELQDILVASPPIR